jgi:hypothetical protein
MSDLPEGLPDPIALLTERARESEAHTQQRAARDAELTRFHEDHQVVRKRVENALNRARPDESDLWRIKRPGDPDLPELGRPADSAPKRIEVSAFVEGWRPRLMEAAAVLDDYGLDGLFEMPPAGAPTSHIQVALLLNLARRRDNRRLSAELRDYVQADHQTSGYPALFGISSRLYDLRENDARELLECRKRLDRRKRFPNYRDWFPTALDADEEIDELGNVIQKPVTLGRLIEYYRTPVDVEQLYSHLPGSGRFRKAFQAKYGRDLSHELLTWFRGVLAEVIHEPFDTLDSLKVESCSELLERWVREGKEPDAGHGRTGGGTGAAGKGLNGASSVEPKLGAREVLVLLALLNLGAVNGTNKVKRGVVAMTINRKWKVHHISRTLAKLKTTLQYTDSDKGPDSGVWLTPGGEARARRL